MKKDRQTKERLLKAAKEEFLREGYMKASLRNICKRAEVTTGAMYFFFQDKEDLFGSLVEKPLQDIYDMAGNHYREEADVSAAVSSEKRTLGALKEQERKEHEESALRILDYLYEYQDEFVLLLTKSQGSRYENSLKEFEEYTEKHYRQMADVMNGLTGRRGMNEDTLHCIVHMQLTAFIQPITHRLAKDRAKAQVRELVKFMLGGWYGLWD